MKESEGPNVKSMVTDLPNAVSAGQLPNIGLESAFDNHIQQGDIPLVRGLQVLYV